MSISDGRTSLSKIAFQIGDRFFRFAINPESMTHSNPHRTAVTKTKSRIVIEDFQSDVPTYTIAGTTGFNPTGREEDRGINKIKELKAYLKDFAEMGGNGNTADVDFYFHNFTNDESFVVSLATEGVTFSQDVNSPLTYKYEIKFVILRDAGQPSEKDIVDPEIGNRYPSVIYQAVPLPSPVLPSMDIPMPTPSVPDSSIPMPNPAAPSTGGNNTTGTFDPASGNNNIYNQGTYSPYAPSINTDPVNPQAPSHNSFQYGMTGLGYNIGYYGRSY